MTDGRRYIKSPAIEGLLVATTAGVLIGAATAHWKPVGAILAMCIAAGLGAWPALHFGFRRRLLTLAPLLSFGCLLLLCFSSTALRTRIAFLPPDTPDTLLMGAEVFLTGRVASIPDSTAFSTRFVLDARAFEHRKHWTPLIARIQVSLPHSPVERADIVLARGVLSRPRPARNPAGFDEREFLENKGIHFTFRADTVIAIGTSSSPGSSLSRFVLSSRHRVYEIIHRYVDNTEARAVLKALIAGDRTSIDSETQNDFRESGLLHVLAVSGLHVLLVGMTVYHLLRPALARMGLSWRAVEWIRTVLTLGLLFFYMMIAGAGASVVRAVIMAGIAIGASFFQRPFLPLHTLFAVGLILLLAHPLYLFDVGFQLSFSAVASIMLFTTPLREAFAGMRIAAARMQPVAISCVVSLAATLGTMPVLLYHFGRVSFAGLLLNPIAIPLTSAALCAGLLVLFISLISPVLAKLIGFSAEALIQALLLTAEKGAFHLDFLSLHIPPFSSIVFTLMIATLVLFVVAMHRRRWMYLVVALGGWGGHVAVKASMEPESPSVEVVFFDVGHGDAALVMLPGDRRILIDAGNRTRFSDPAARVILPFLRRYDIETIDALVISHPHSDHYGGLASLLERIRIGRILLNGSPTADGPLHPLLRRAASQGTVLETLAAGDTLDYAASVRIRTLSPSVSFARRASPNESSLVLQVKFGAVSVLFLGDAERAAEEQLIARFPEFIRSDVIKVGHHGSRTSSTPAFIEATGRAVDWAVISTGAASVYGLPDEEVIENWQESTRAIHVTSDSGALWLTTDGMYIRRKSW